MVNEINNGGPAFARTFGESEREDYSKYWRVPAPYAHAGMSLRDYFAAHAPSQVPEWFKYQSTEPRPKALMPWDIPEEERSDFIFVVDGCLDICDAPPATQEWHAKYKESLDAVDAWKDREVAERYFAWRWHYADMMLKARGE